MKKSEVLIHLPFNSSAFALPSLLINLNVS
jgi:hypothetical protein